MKTKTSVIFTLLSLLCVLCLLASCNSGASKTEPPAGSPSAEESVPAESTPMPSVDCEHEVVKDAAVEPTCNTQGKTQGSHCSKCGEILEVQTKSPAKGHSYEGDSCSVCGYTPSKGLLYEHGKFWDNDTLIEGYLVSIGSCTDTDIKIADVYNGEPVVAIDSEGFENSKIQSVHIPYSVVLIGRNAFCDNEYLKTVILEYGIKTIQSEAFSGSYNVESVYISDLEAWCQINYKDFESPVSGKKLYLNGMLLTDLIIPTGITAIKDYAFYEIDSIVNVTIPNSVKSIGEDAFNSCSGIKNIALGNNVESVGADAFQFCDSLESIIIPDNVTIIGSEAFDGCANLKDIVLSKGITELGRSAFRDTAYYNNKSNWENDALYIGECLVHVDIEEDYDEEILLENYEIKEGTVLIANSAFEDCEEVLKITIPTSVKHIGRAAFGNCRNLKEISFPGSIVSIGKGVLYDCDQLEKLSIVFPASKDEDASVSIKYLFTSDYGKPPKTLKMVKVIGNEIPENAFRDCEHITDIVISESVTSIGEYVFNDCTSLTDIWCEATEKPDGWPDTWSSLYYSNYNSPATVHWGDEWEYVNGVPTLK